MIIIFIDGCMKEMKIEMRNVGARLKIIGNGWTVVAYLFADDNVVCRE